VFVNYRYLEQRSIVTNRMCLARAIENYGFPKPYALGANRLSWDLERSRGMDSIAAPARHEERREKAVRRFRGGS
jgi:hypothetical protein